MKRSGLVVALAVVGTLLTWRWMEGGRDPITSPDSAPPDERPAPQQNQPSRERMVGSLGLSGVQRLAPDARRKLLAAISAARQLRLDAEASRRREEGAPSASEPPQFGKDYIRERVQDIIPLVKECFENELRDKPDLEGKIVVEFVIGGEPDVGAIIEESKIAAGSTIEDASLRECVQETMYALEFRAPERGGKVVVKYPFLLRGAGDDEPQEAR